MGALGSLQPTTINGCDTSKPTEKIEVMSWGRYGGSRIEIHLQVIGLKEQDQLLDGT